MEHLLRQRNIPFFQLAQLQRIVDQRHQVAGCHAGLSAAGIDQLPVIRVLAANFQQTNDAIEQRAHIMGQPGREISQRPVGLLHIFQFFHAAQGLPQAVHGGRQFFRQLFRLQRGGTIHQPVYAGNDLFRRGYAGLHRVVFRHVRFHRIPFLSLLCGFSVCGGSCRSTIRPTPAEMPPR